MLHGDLKPENVLINGSRPDGSPFCIVCDFGHATVCIGSAQVAAPGDPRYIAPEVVIEEGLSPKSDIYMLGVTAFELLTGGWLPFFQAKAVTLYASYYKLKFGGVKEAIVSSNGLEWRDQKRLKDAITEAGLQSSGVDDLVRSMLARNAVDRPSAVEILRSQWLQEAALPCKSAYDAMLRSSTSSGWGLWMPAHPQFAARLRQRASASWTCRLVLAILGSSLEPLQIHGARLLFRRMDEGGEGTLSKRRFCAAAMKAGVSQEEAEALFEAGDLHEQGFIDFKNMVMLFLDLEAFDREDLLAQLRSVLNRLCGPSCSPVRPAQSRFERQWSGASLASHSGGPPVAVAAVASGSGFERAISEDDEHNPTIDINELISALRTQSDARIGSVFEDIRKFLGEKRSLLTAEVLLEVLEVDPFA